MRIKCLSSVVTPERNGCDGCHGQVENAWGPRHGHGHHLQLPWPSVSSFLLQTLDVRHREPKVRSQLKTECEQQTNILTLNLTLKAPPCPADRYQKLVYQVLTYSQYGVIHHNSYTQHSYFSSPLTHQHSIVSPVTFRVTKNLLLKAQLHLPDQYLLWFRLTGATEEVGG